MKVLALHVGMPRTLIREGGELYTGGEKAEADEAMLRFPGFEGDRVADKVHHGGPDRAACVYPAAHYAWWKSERGYELGMGAFCENLSVDGLLESELCIGDVFRVGEALVQVSLPRDPCRTIDRIAGIPGLHSLAKEAGKCGFHMRVLEEGRVRRGDAFELAQRHPAGISVAASLDLYHGRSTDPALVAALLGMEEFADEGKRRLAKLGN